MNTLQYQQAFRRIRSEFFEIPHMRLRPPEVAGIAGAVCKSVLDDVVRAGFLRTWPDGSLRRVDGRPRITVGGWHSESNMSLQTGERGSPS